MGFKNTGKLKSNDEIIKEFQSVHGIEEYDYSEVNYTGVFCKVFIKCNFCGLKHEWTALSHKKGRICPCKKKHYNKKTNKEYIKQLKEVYKNSFQYHLVEYRDAKKPVTVICNSCTTKFSQEASYLLIGRGCPTCNIKNRNEKFKSNTQEFIQKAKNVHKDKFDYSLVIYKTARDYVTIICPIHGEFEQTPNNHLRGRGCNECRFEKSTSEAENKIIEFLKNLNINVIQSYRPKWLDGKELDVYLPDYNLAIEYNGLTYHHSSKGLSKFLDNTYVDPKFHLNKFNKCKENNIKLIHMFEHENFNNWLEQIKNYLENQNNYDISFNNILRNIILHNREYIIYGESHTTPYNAV